MKKFFVSIFLLFGIVFTSCDLFPFFEEDELIDLTVFAFSEESVVLKWTTSEANSRFNIYVKDKDGIEKCVENNYGKKDFFVVSDNKSSYAIGLLVNDKEIYKTNFFYPDLEKGFFVRGEISEDGYIGVEFLYPSNVEKFHVETVKENSNTITPTNKYSAEELNSYLLPICYEEGSHNNYFNVLFTIGENEYKSAKYYFDYEAHLIAIKEGFVVFYPSL